MNRERREEILTTLKKERALKYKLSNLTGSHSKANWKDNFHGKSYLSQKISPRKEYNTVLDMKSSRDTAQSSDCYSTAKAKLKLFTQLKTTPYSKSGIKDSHKKHRYLYEGTKMPIEDTYSSAQKINERYNLKKFHRGSRSVTSLGSFGQLSNRGKEILQEQEGLLKEQCTFRPKINQPRLGSREDLTHEERILKLYSSANGRVESREKQKYQKDNEEFESSCTFQPKLFSSPIRDNSDPVEDRLYEDAYKRMEHDKTAYIVKEANELGHCTFHPKIISNIEQIPIHKRYKDLQNEKSEKIMKLKMKAEENTFKPMISNRSIELATNISEEPSVEKRLYSDANRRIRRENIKTTLNSYKTSPIRHPNIHDQDKFRLPKNKKNCVANYLADTQCTFKPEINLNSKIIADRDEMRNNESMRDKAMRLSKKTSQSIEEVKPQKKLTYQSVKSIPKVATNSLNYQVKEKNYIKQIEESRRKELQECTFNPNINKSGIRSIYEKGSNFLNIEREKRRELDTRREQNKRDLEYEEMKDCSFRPKINTFTEIPNDVRVNGWGNYCEKMQRKNSKEKEQRWRENEIFGHSEKYDERIKQKEGCQQRRKIDNVCTLSKDIPKEYVYKVYNK